MVGRDGLHTAPCHCHCRIGLEPGHPQERNQCPGYVLADTAAVSEVHFCLVQGIALSLAHSDAGIPDIVGHPVRKDGYLLHLGLLPPDQPVHFRLGLRSRLETSVVLIDFIEPQRLVLPARGG